MIISYEMPVVSSVTVNQGTLISASAANLYDGRPGTSVIMETPASTASNLRFTVAFATPIEVADVSYLVIKLDNVRADSWPTAPMVAVSVTGGGIAFFARAVVLNPANEYQSRSLLIPGSAFTPGGSITAIQFEIVNQVGSSAVSVGEAFISRGYELCLSKLAEAPVDPSATRRSDGNQPWPLFRIPFRRINATVVQQTYQNAFVDSENWPVPGNLRNLLFGAARAEKLCVVTRWRYNRGTAANQDMIDDNTIIARMTDVSGLEGEAGVDRWPATLTLEESL